MSNYIFPDGPYGDVLQAVYNEIKRAKDKHGPKNFNSSHEGYAVLAEEVDEMWDEVKRDNLPDAVMEAIQVAAMAVRFAAELGQYPYTPPKEQKKDFDILPVFDEEQTLSAYRKAHPAASHQSIARFKAELTLQRNGK